MNPTYLNFSQKKFYINDFFPKKQRLFADKIEENA